MTYKVIKNTSISSLKRKKNRINKGFDIEDPYLIGNIKNNQAWPWWCKKPGCGHKLVPYKEDEFGDIIMSCTNPNCIGHRMHANSINVQLKKLLKQQQNSSTLYYRRLDGRYY